jgi:hypothetical protein
MIAVPTELAQVQAAPLKRVADFALCWQWTKVVANTHPAAALPLTETANPMLRLQRAFN